MKTREKPTACEPHSEDSGGALPLAIILVYLVIVGLFQSFIDPLIILGAVPLGFIGVIRMLLLTHTSVNVESLIGSLMMIGIVVSNSVLLVDFANRRLRDGRPLKDALIEAGRLRIRPILMTALATVLGLAPMALGLGEGSEMNAPLGRAVIGGLLVRERPPPSGHPGAACHSPTSSCRRADARVPLMRHPRLVIVVIALAVLLGAIAFVMLREEQPASSQPRQGTPTPATSSAICRPVGPEYPSGLGAATSLAR